MASAKPKRQPQLPGDDWPEIGSEFGTVTLRPEEDGPVIGAYQGVREVETTDPQGRPRMSTLHAFKLEDGNVVEIWGSYDLDRKLTEELVGQLVRVEYNQTIPISGGAQQLKLYRVRAKG